MMEIKIDHKPFPKNFFQGRLGVDTNSIKLAKNMKKYNFVRQKKCYVCNSTKTKEECSFYDITYLRCLNCSHVYTDKRLSEKSLKEFYSENEDYFTHSNLDRSIIKTRIKIFEPKIRFAKRFSKGRKWLDIGAGEGTAVKVAQKLGFESKGFELSDVSRRFALENYGIRLEKELTHEKFDVVSLFGVLEHIPNPLRELKNYKRLLNKNSIMVLEVPNYDCVSTDIQKTIKHPTRHLYPHFHIMMFTQKSMELILRKAGLKPLAIWYFGQDVIELSRRFPSLLEYANEIQRIIDKNHKSDEFIMIASNTI